MSSKARSSGDLDHLRAPVFAALGDVTRLALLAKLSSGDQRSITDLASGMELTRQAVTKHLRVLEEAGLVRCSRAGRESRYAFRPEPIDDLKTYLDRVSSEWDDALGRLKALIEK